jgi:hypothetical protein
MAPEQLAGQMNSHSSGGWTGGYLNADSGTIGALNTTGSWIALLDPTTNPGHFVVVDGVNSTGDLSIRDPEGLSYSMTESDFMSHWADQGGFGGVVFKQP